MTSDDLQLAPAAHRATMREFFAVVFRRRWVIVGLFLATTTTVAWIALTTPTFYVSSARVLIKRGEKESVLMPSRQMFAGWEEELSTEIEVIRSVPVIQRTREILEAQSDSGTPPVTVSAHSVDAEVMGKSNVVAIAYVDPDPEVARRVCDAVVRAYTEFRQKDLSLAYPREFFETELARVGAELDGKVEERREFANSTGVVDAGGLRQNLLGQLSVLASRRDESAAELAEARTARQRMEELRTRQNVDLPTFASSFSNENALVSIKSKMIEQETKVAQLRERLRDDSPDVVAAVNTLNTLRSMLEREVDARLAMWDSRVDMLAARADVYERDYAAVQAQLDELPDKETTITSLDREISLLKQRYQELSQRRDLAHVTMNTSSQVSIILLSPASPAVPGNARDYARLALAPAFSLVVGVGLAFFLDGLDVTVHTSGHAEEAAELPVLAAIRERRRRA